MNDEVVRSVIEAKERKQNKRDDEFSKLYNKPKKKSAKGKRTEGVLGKLDIG